MKTTYLALLLGALFLVTTAFECENEQTFFTIECGAFDNSLLEYFPYQPGDVFTFQDVNGTDERSFRLADRLIFADTTYQSIVEGEVCSPFAEFLVTELDEERTLINFFINQLNQDAGVFLGINFADRNIAGSPYFQQVLLEPQIGGGFNSMVTEVGSLQINGTVYQDVILTELLDEPDFVDQFFNDIRKIWIARGAGIVQFEDIQTGVTWGLQP